MTLAASAATVSGNENRCVVDMGFDCCLFQSGKASTLAAASELQELSG